MSINIASPFRLIHEDPGAVSTAFAVAHLKLGLARTKGHDFKLDNQTGEVIPYAHHPPGSGLVTALGFAAFNSHAPVLARGGSAVFHLLSFILLILFLQRFFTRWETLLGAFCLAVMPMSNFFGKLVGPEPLTLPAMLIFVLSYFQWFSQEEDSASWRPPLFMLLAGFWGALCGWPIFFAMLGTLGHSVSCWLTTKEKRFLKMSLYIAALGLAFFAMNLGHIYWASGADGLKRLATGLSSAAGETESHHPWWQMPGHVLEYCRRYFTEIVFLSSLFYLFELFQRGSRGIPLRLIDHISLVFFFMALMNILFFPNRARNHHYWPFYFLPFMTVGFLETLNFLKQRYRKQELKITAACLILISGSAAVTLYKRHTRESAYTIKALEEFQRYF